MPHLNPEFFLSQLFWLVCFFMMMYFFLHRVFMPQVREVLHTREKQIKHDIAAAEQAMTSCQRLQSEANKALDNAKEAAMAARLQAVQQAKTFTLEETARIEDTLHARFAEYETDLLRMRAKMMFELGNEYPHIEQEVVRVLRFSLQHPIAVTVSLKN